MNDKIFIAEVQTDLDDLNPYRFHFLDEEERDRFLDALKGHRRGDDYLTDGEWDLIYATAAEAVEDVKKLMGWKELPAIQEPE